MRSVVVLLGGFDPPTRRADIAAGHRPMNDVGLLEREFGATVLDLGWLVRSPRRPHRVLAAIARRTGQWSAALALAAVGEMRRHDVVYASGEDVGVVAAPALRLAQLLGGRRATSGRFVLRVERAVYGRSPLRRALHRWAMRRAAPRVDVALCRTAGVAAALVEHARLPADRTRVLGQEIDTDFFAPDAPGPGETGSPTGLPTGLVPGQYLLSAGLERRDHGTLLEAVEDLDVPVVIAAGSPWSKDVFDVDRELPANVVVGSFDPLEMRELHRGAAALVLAVHPTERACGMNVIGEAWAMGRPVVVTATDGLREYVTDGVDGLLVPVGDAVALRGAIERVLGDPDLAARLGAAGRVAVVERLALCRYAAAVQAAMADTP